MKRIIFLLGILVLLSGCTVTKAEIEFAETVCKEEGGLEFYRNPITLNNSLLGDAHCSNGVVVIGEQWSKNNKARMAKEASNE